MSAVITPAKTRQLDSRAEPQEQVTPAQAADSDQLARLLMRILREIAALKRRYWPQFFDYEDRTVDGTGTTIYDFPHGFNSRVRWWPVDWTGATAGPRLVRHTTSDYNTLRLVSYTAGTLTLRVEAGG